VQFVEAAKKLAESALLTGGDSDAARIDFMSRRLLVRSFRADELAIVAKSLADLQRYYSTRNDDAQQLIAVGESKADARLEPSLLAAWTMLANQLMNLDELLNK
jgi:hypothetical protein